MISKSRSFSRSDTFTTQQWGRKTGFSLCSPIKPFQEAKCETSERSKNNQMNLSVTITLCALGGLCWFTSFRPAKAEHNLPPVIRQHVDQNDNAMVPACRTITSYLNHAANPNA